MAERVCCAICGQTFSARFPVGGDGTPFPHRHRSQQVKSGTMVCPGSYQPALALLA